MNELEAELINDFILSKKIYVSIFYHPDRNYPNRHTFHVHTLDKHSVITDFSDILNHLISQGLLSIEEAVHLRLSS